MTKTIFFSVLMVFAVSIGSAQIQKGNLMLGTDLGNEIVNKSSTSLLGFNFGLNSGAGYSLGISPKIGYFIEDNLLIGGVVNLNYTKSPRRDEISTKTTTYGVQALSRYYLNPGEKGIDNLAKHGRFFVEANAGFAGVNVKHGPTTNGFVFGIGPGYSYFLNQYIALEGTLKYNGLVGGGNTTYQHDIGFNIGIQVFLPSSQAKKRMEKISD